MDLDDENFIESLSTKIIAHSRAKRHRSSSSDEGAPDPETPVDLAMLKEVKEELTGVLFNLEQKLNGICGKLDGQDKRLQKVSKTVEDNWKVSDNIRNELDILRRQNHEHIETIKKEVASNKKELQRSNESIKKLSADVTQLNKDKMNAARKIIDLESRGRRCNLLFFGVEESRGEKCEEKIQAFIANQLNLNCAPVIQRAHRLGAPRHNMIGSRASAPRPIIVNFLDFKQKELVRSQRHVLKAPFGLADDLPLAVRKAQKTLLGDLHELKKSNNRAAIVYPCKLVSNGKVVKEIDVAKFFEA